MYVARSQEEILAELQTLVSSNTSKIEGTFIFDCLSSNAIEFAKFSQELAECYQNAFLHTCSAEYLDLRAGEIGLTRKPAQAATGTVTVTGNGTVYAGNIFSTAKNTRFVASETVEVDGTAKIPVEAEKAGAVGNVAAGMIIKMPLSIPGIRTCTNAEATHDGYNEESDDELRERALIKARYPAASGNPTDYINSALAVTGVGAARLIRCWDGPGTVKVIISDSNFDEASDDLLEKVAEKIEEWRPVAAIVTVVSARTKNINIAAKIDGVLDETAFLESLQKYFQSLVKSVLFASSPTAQEMNAAAYVSLARINALFFNAGVDDVHNLTLNGESCDIPLSIDEIPRVGILDF